MDALQSQFHDDLFRPTSPVTRPAVFFREAARHFYFDERLSNRTRGRTTERPATTTRRALYFCVVMCLFSFAFLKNLTDITDVTGDAGQRDRLRLLGTAWDLRTRQCPKHLPSKSLLLRCFRRPGTFGTATSCVSRARFIFERTGRLIRDDPIAHGNTENRLAPCTSPLPAAEPIRWGAPSLIWARLPPDGLIVWRIWMKSA
jgi:hypothetical protein